MAITEEDLVEMEERATGCGAYHTNCSSKRDADGDPVDGALTCYAVMTAGVSLLVAAVRRLQTFEAAMRAEFGECPIHGETDRKDGEPCPDACPWNG